MMPHAVGRQLRGAEGRKVLACEGTKRLVAIPVLLENLRMTASVDVGLGILAAKAVNALKLPENGAAVAEEELMHSLMTDAHSLVHFLFGGYLTWLAGRF